MGCCPSDLWKAYSGVLSSKQHRAVGKESGETNHIKQSISKLGRKTLSFSKKAAHHVVSIGYFIHHYIASLLIHYRRLT